MFKMIRRIILLGIIGVVAIGGYFLFNHNKSVTGTEKVTDTVVLDSTKNYTLDVYKLGVKGNKGKINVHPMSGSEAYITYTVNKGLIDEYGFDIKVDGNKIDIFTEHNYAYDVDKFEIDIYCDYHKLILSSSLDIDVDATGVDSLDVTYKGTNSLDIKNINMDTFKMNTNSSGKVKLSGNIAKLEFVSKGSGDIDAKDLATTNADITLDGTGDMVVSVLDTLNVAINDKGNLTYYGEPNIEKTGDGEGNLLQVKD